MFLDVKKLDKKEHLIGFFGVDLEGKFDYLQKSLTKSDSRFSKFSNPFLCICDNYYTVGIWITDIRLTETLG